VGICRHIGSSNPVLGSPPLLPIKDCFRPRAHREAVAGANPALAGAPTMTATSGIELPVVSNVAAPLSLMMGCEGSRVVLGVAGAGHPLRTPGQLSWTP
jgi:hypothetical protein